MTPWELRGRELANCTCECEVEIDDKYGQFARLHLNNHGVVRARAAA